MVLDIFLHIPKHFKNKIIYTIENIFFPYKISINIKSIEGGKSDSQIKLLYIYEEYLIPDFLSEDHNLIIIVLKTKTLDFFNYFRKYDTQDINYINDIPCLFPNKSSTGFSFDIFAASFYFISCWQEYAIQTLDRKGRIPIKETIQYDLNIINKPIVNEYLKIFEKHIYKLTQKRIEYKLIFDKKTVILLSHDIDHIDWAFRDYLKRLRRFLPMQSLNYKDLLRIFTNIRTKKTIFEKLKQIEQGYEAGASHFFLSNYNEKFLRFIKELKKLLDTDTNEIGHHISDETIYDKSLKSDLFSFDSRTNNCYGERVHTLRFQTKDLFKQLEINNYLYDSSLLFAEQLGYRTGFSYAHYIYNPLKDRPFRTLSIAPNIMETTVFEKKYLGLSDKDGFNEITLFIKKSLQYSGYISILFHHSFFWFNSYTRLEFYKELLSFIKMNDIEFCTHKQFCQWHKQNKNIMNIEVYENGF